MNKPLPGDCGKSKFIHRCVDFSRFFTRYAHEVQHDSQAVDCQQKKSLFAITCCNRQPPGQTTWQQTWVVHHETCKQFLGLGLLFYTSRKVRQYCHIMSLIREQRSWKCQWRSQGGGQPPPPNWPGKKNKINIRDFEVSRGLSSPKSPDISTRLRLSTFEDHLLLLPPRITTPSQSW